MNVSKESNPVVIDIKFKGTIKIMGGDPKGQDDAISQALSKWNSIIKELKSRYGIDITENTEIHRN